jgi:hypothetical protein
MRRSKWENLSALGALASCGDGSDEQRMLTIAQQISRLWMLWWTLRIDTGRSSTSEVEHQRRSELAACKVIRNEERIIVRFKAG